ncbi:MAG: flippase-like domain-containing protein [Bacteroidetes bacterium]|jgi:uncharacterized protein (TIRG00374 family)|nr:flippase-like domain-containing protein [Bacteroidota bacterium]
MRFSVKNILFYAVFLAIGIGIFIYIYQGYDKDQFFDLLGVIDYRWLALSLIVSIFSHYLRAVRWNMLIEPLGYKPAVKNTFMAVLVLYCVNVIIPRAGEIARCGILKQYEKVPFTSLVGTVLIERIADVIVLGLISVYVLIAHYTDILEFFNVNQNQLKSFEDIPFLQFILIAAGALLLLLLLYFIVKRNKKLMHKINEIKQNFVLGIRTIKQLKNTWLFIFYSIGIYGVYLLMLYFIFFAYPPTNQLTLSVGLFTFFMSALAMLAPIQAGMGAWHFMVINSLAIYGISQPEAKDFALLAHTSTNMVYLVIGFIAYLLLPLINRKTIKVE